MKAEYTSLLSRLPLPAQPAYPQGTPFVPAWAHGSMRLELFCPATSGLGRDVQQPHEQDELYVIQAGTAQLWLQAQDVADVPDGFTLSLKAGDVAWVPAGRPHRFEVFSDDFVTWVIFYGPPGGES